MKYFWQTPLPLLVMAANLFPMASIQASGNSSQLEHAQATHQPVLQIAQADAGEAYKWAIKPTDQPATQLVAQPTPQPAGAKPEAPLKTTYFQRARSHGTHPESDPPRYVRNLAKTGIDAFKHLYWLDVGLDQRERFEIRNNDLRRPFLTTDYNLLHRTRAYIGVREILDPFRFVVEFEEARRSFTKFVPDTRDVNTFELIQTFGELYFRGALGQDDLGNQRPVRIRGGRMAWEAVDRRLIGNNQWRNTTNNFEGFRINLGQEANDWELDFWGVQPVIRETDEFDGRNKSQWFYGGILNWRRWSDVVTFQPYYMGLKQDGRDGRQAEREVHSPGIRGFGVIPGTGIDYDFGAIYQFGRENSQKKAAWAYLAEIGYTFNHPWKPRLSTFYGFASGDRNPNDNVNNRFERFFGFGRPWSADDNLIFENVKAPKIKVEFQPHPDLAVDGGYNWFWLASDTDRFNNILNGINGDQRFNRDSTGNSGDFLGHSIDFRARYKLMSRVDTTIGYSHWFNGEFVKNRQLAALGESAKGSNFFYVEVSIRAFK